MAASSLETFIQTVRASWSYGTDRRVIICRDALADLSRAQTSESWLAQLHSEMPAARELHRDPAHGFMLLAHAESEGLYRPPHDHGRAWVVYAVGTGELEIGTYQRVASANDKTRLVERDRSVMRPGEARAYLVGDIHDTRCLTDTALLFRFTERDLRREDQVEGKVTRFVMQDGQWRAQHP